MKIQTTNPKFLIVENDCVLGDYFRKYLENEKIITKEDLVDGWKNTPHVIYGLEHRTTEEMAEYFSKYDILLLEPTMITFHQYNGLMMLMYDLLTKGTLKIKEIQLYHHDERIERELRALWYNKRKFLDLMIPHIKIYRIYDIEKQKIEINLHNNE